MLITTSAPAKVILFGEHFVVKGVPAIVSAIKFRATVRLKPSGRECIRIASKQMGGDALCGDKIIKGKDELKPYFNIVEKWGVKGGVDIEIDSNIPVGAGLGSSAATSVALAGALVYSKLKSFDHKKIYELAMVGERAFHGNPSGVDPLVSLKGGMLIFRNRKDYDRIEARMPDDIRLVLVDTGVKRKTRDAVEKVLMRYERHYDIMKHVYEAAESLVMEAKKALEKGDYVNVGELMMINQGLLNSIGVSFPEAEKIIDLAVKAGALGAKITGAGLGGMVLILSEEYRIKKIIHALENYGGVQAFEVSMDPIGVRLEH